MENNRLQVKGFPHLSYITLEEWIKLALKQIKIFPQEDGQLDRKVLETDNYEDGIISTILYASVSISHKQKKKKRKRKFPDP